MKKEVVANRIRDFRNRQGLSQEALAEMSGISHRTVQRIENGESNPTGDTLQRIALALGLTPDQLVDWTIQEDSKFLVYMNLSSLFFLVFPLLGVLIPFIMWVSKKDKVKNAEKTGTELINFQITWVVFLALVPIVLYLMLQIGLLSSLSLKTLIFAVLFFYIVNIAYVISNTLRLLNGRQVSYFSVIKILK